MHRSSHMFRSPGLMALAVASLLASVAIVARSHAEVFTLAAGSADRIQDLIDAEVAAGDVIELGAGDFAVASAINFRGLGITLRGSVGKSGEATTRLVGAGGTGILACLSGEDAATVIEDLVVMDGDIDLGAGLLINQAGPTVRRVRFQDNVASVFGGGVAIFGASSAPSFDACAFIGNRADLVGGGVLNGTDATPVYRDCFWSDNTVGLYGRAAYNQVDSMPTFEGCEVVGCCEVVPPESFNDAGGNLIEATCEDCRSDLNCYGGVGSADLGLLLGAWGTDLESYDLDGDGTVGGSDIGVLVGGWGACPG